MHRHRPRHEATPFCTIGAATKKAQAGDTVLVGAGTYREQLSVTTGGGEQAAPLTVHATTPNAVILGSDDLSGTAGWTATTTTAWQHAFAPNSTPTQVWLDGQPLAMASSATTTTTGTWFYDGVAKLLYVDVGGANPGTATVSRPVRATSGSWCAASPTSTSPASPSPART